MIKLTKEALRRIFPRAPQAVIDAFYSKQDVLTAAGINATRTRLGYFLANIEHECDGFALAGLTENINYTAKRMAEVWPKRFASAAAVVAKYGSAPGWQRKAFDDIYGNRMGNRPGTSDGSRYIGRGGPQWTGRDGYAALERLTGMPAVDNPEIATRLDMQPEVCAAFWRWKGMNRYADAGDFLGCVKAWNGGTNGMADRRRQLAGNESILAALEGVEPAKKAPSKAPAVAPSVNAKPAKKAPSKAVAPLAGAATVAVAAHQAGVSPWIIAGVIVAAVAVAAAVVLWVKRR